MTAAAGCGGAGGRVGCHYQEQLILKNEERGHVSERKRKDAKIGLQTEIGGSSANTDLYRLPMDTLSVYIHLGRVPAVENEKKRMNIPKATPRVLSLPTPSLSDWNTHFPLLSLLTKDLYAISATLRKCC